jgi:hypothetical protein
MKLKANGIVAVFISLFTTRKARIARTAERSFDSGANTRGDPGRHHSVIGGLAGGDRLRSALTGELQDVAQLRRELLHRHTERAVDFHRSEMLE